MRVLIVSSKYPPIYSGSGNRAHRTILRLQQKFDIKFDVVSSSMNLKNRNYIYENINIISVSGPLRTPKNVSFLKFFNLINMPFEMIRSWLFIKNKISNYDLIHTFGNSWSIGFLSWYFDKKGKRVIRELCNDMPSPFYPKQFENLISPLFKLRNNLIIAISPKLETLAKNYGAIHIWMRPNPIDEKMFYLRDESEITRLKNSLFKFSKERKILGSIANISQRKNQLFLLKILKHLPKEYCLFIGGVVQNDYEGGRTGKRFISSNSYLNKLNKYVEENNLKDRVEILPEFILNPGLYMSAFDVFLFPSIHEGLGTPIIEAQACGTPVISNILPGISDYWIKDNISGFSLNLIEEIWAEKILKIHKLSKTRMQLRSKSILEIANTDIIDSEYLKKYKELL